MRKEPKVKLTRQSECSLHNVRNESVFAPKVRLLFFDQIGTEDQDFILRQDKGKLKLELRRLGSGAYRMPRAPEHTMVNSSLAAAAYAG